MPFADNPAQWFRNIGLDPERTTVIERLMPFPPENRVLSTSRGRSSGCPAGVMKSTGRRSSGRSNTWRTATPVKRADPHGELARAEKLHEDLPKGLSILHEQDGGLHDDAWYLDRWQTNDADVFLSPALTDGVDLPDETCR